MSSTTKQRADYINMILRRSGARPIRGLAKILAKTQRDMRGRSSFWKCRICGCTDGNPRLDAFGGTCHWISQNLCSTCATAAKRQRRSA